MTLDSNEILAVLPHRPPFLLVDCVTACEPGSRATGRKCVTVNEPFFQGHFPGQPVMPGVLILEALAQVGGILLLNAEVDPATKLVYFTGIDNVRFRKTVTPGDVLRFEVELTAARRSMCKMMGRAFVDDELVCEAELMAAIVDSKNEEPSVM